MIKIFRICRKSSYRAKIEFHFIDTEGHGLHEFIHDPSDRPRVWLMRPLKGTTAIRFDVLLFDVDGQQLTHLELTAKPMTLAIVADRLGLTIAHHDDEPSLFPVLRVRA